MSEFTCFDDLANDDCAYTEISAVTVDTTVTLTFTSVDATTIDLECPFEGQWIGDDCTEQTITCEGRGVKYNYDNRDYRFSVQCSRTEHEFTSRDDDVVYPECPSEVVPQ